MIKVDDKFNIIPKSILRKSISLINIGITELAWRYENIGELIEWLTINKNIILGGDVYKLDGEKIAATFDSWCIPSRKKESIDEYILKGVETTNKYIDLYHRNHGASFCYVLVFSSNVKLKEI